MGGGSKENEALQAQHVYLVSLFTQKSKLSHWTFNIAPKIGSGHRAADHVDPAVVVNKQHDRGDDSRRNSLWISDGSDHSQNDKDNAVVQLSQLPTRLPDPLPQKNNSEENQQTASDELRHKRHDRAAIK